jgi:SAM-dependent methyltransferase
MTLSLERQNRYRERFRAAHRGWEPATDVYEKFIRGLLRPGMTVLDIGCGRGGVFEQLGTAVDKPVGIDPDGTSLVEHRIPTLPRAAARADKIPFRDGSIDIILCSWVLEHVENPDQVFSELARCLTVAGKFVFLTPNARSAVTVLNRLLRPLQRQLVARLYGRAEVDTFPVVYKANTPAAIQALAARHGLSVAVLKRIEDPTYLAFNPALYRASVLLSRVTPPVHLVGILEPLAVPAAQRQR